MASRYPSRRDLAPFAFFLVTWVAVTAVLSVLVWGLLTDWHWGTYCDPMIPGMNLSGDVCYSTTWDNVIQVPLIVGLLLSAALTALWMDRRFRHDG